MPNVPITDEDRECLRIVDDILRQVHDLVNQQRIPPNTVVQALLTVLARIIGQQPEPLKPLVICVRALIAATMAEARSRGCNVSPEAATKAIMEAATVDIAVMHVDTVTGKTHEELVSRGTDAVDDTDKKKVN